MRWLLNIPQRAPRSTLAVILVLTAFFGIFAGRIRVDSSMDNLLPAHDPDRVFYNGVRQEFGSEEVTVIGIFADDVFNHDTLAKVARLSKDLAAIDGVREVLSLSTVKSVSMDEFGMSTGRLMRRVPETAEAIDALRQKALANPMYLKNLISADGKATSITVVYEPMSDRAFLESGIEGRVRALVDRARGPERMAITGIPTMKVFGAHYMESDILKFMPLSVLLVIVVLTWAFRTPRGVLLPLITVLVGVIWTNGLMVLTDTPITMGTLVLTPLLMAIGIAYAIHVVSQYYQELRPDRSVADVVHATMEHIRVPVGIAALTTLVGFATFIPTEISAIREFGLYSVFGIGAILVVSLTLIPAALLLLPVPKRVRAQHDENSWLTRLLASLGETVVRRRNAVLLTGAAICVVGLLGISRIRVETDYLGFFSPSSIVRTDNAQVADQLAGTQPVYVVIDGDGPQSLFHLANVEAVRDLQTFIDRQPGVDKTISFTDYLGMLWKTLQPDAATPLPTKQSEIDQLLMLMGTSDIRAVINKDASRGNILVRTTLSGSSEVSGFVDRVERYAAAHFPRGTKVKATGTVVLLNRSADTLAWAQITSLWQVLVVLLILMSMLFLSVRVGLLSLIPNVVPIIILFGIMGWAGISLNITTSLIAAIAIGIAIDDTIHYLTTFNAEMRKTGSQERAVVNAMRTVGKPMVFTSVALSAGFLIVCLSNFQPVQYFGLLSAITMGVALFSDLFITPALVTTTKIITLWDLMFLKLGPEPQKEIPMFAGLRAFQAKLVVLMARLASAAPGTFIIRRGEIKPEMYVLLNGRAAVRAGENGPVIRSLGRGDVTGEMGLVRHQPRSADVEVTEASEYLILDERSMQRLHRRYPRIAATLFLNLSRTLSDRLEQTTDDLATSRGAHPRQVEK